jgi:hypothetical protein
VRPSTLPALGAALLLALLALLGAAGPLAAQTEGLLQIESDAERFLLRQHALGRLPDLDPGALPLNARRAQVLLDSLADAPGLSAVDRRLVAGFRGTNAFGLATDAVASRTPLYPNGRSFVYVAGDGYGVEVEPLLDLSAGPAYVNRPGGGPEEWARAQTLRRGARLAGHVGRFFTEVRVTENQDLVPLGSRPFRTAPRIGWARTTDPTAESPDPTYDYLRSTGIVGYRDRFVEVRAGRDRGRWGFARGALLLSDYATEYDHVQAHLQAGPFTVQSLYARFLDPRERGSFDGDGVVEQRYGVFHRAALRPGLGLEFEVFEAVVFGDRDDDNRNGFEPAYLVPFALYRAVERDLGSPDNVLLGAGAAWRVAPGWRLYAQGLLDELTAGRFFEDAWTNKWGFVLGAQVVDPAVPGLGRLRDTDLRVEYARLRPYLYAHRDSLTAAVHWADGLGHPAGPNASDLTVRLAHRPTADVEVSLDAWTTVRGRNTDSLNYGADPWRPYTDRVDGPTPTLQGVRQRVAYADLRLGARVLPDAHLGLALQARLTEDALAGGSGVLTPQVFLRWGLAESGPRY